MNQATATTIILVRGHSKRAAGETGGESRLTISPTA